MYICAKNQSNEHNAIFFALWSLLFRGPWNREMTKTIKQVKYNRKTFVFKAVKVEIDIKVTNHRALNFQEWNHTKTVTNFRWRHRRVSVQEGRWWCPALPARVGPRWRGRRSGAQSLASCSPEAGLPYFPSQGLPQSHWMSFLCWSLKVDHILYLKFYFFAHLLCLLQERIHLLLLSLALGAF